MILEPWQPSAGDIIRDVIRIQPVLTPLLQSRSAGMVLAGVAATHLILVALGLPSFSCPLRAATGVPCPGCGLSRGVSALIHGDSREMVSLHVFSPALLLFIILVLAVGVLPNANRASVLRFIDRFEQQTSFALIGLLLLMAYWLVRLLWTGFPAELYR